MMDELMMVSEMSISAVRAAMSVQSRANRQLVVVNDIFGALDLASLNRATGKINKLKGEINSELVELPEDQTTEDITNHLKALSGSFSKMIDAKKVEIDAASKLLNKLLWQFSRTGYSKKRRIARSARALKELIRKHLRKRLFIRKAERKQKIYFGVFIGRLKGTRVGMV